MTDAIAIKKIAELAHLSSTAANEQQLKQDLEHIIQFMAQLKDVDTQGVSPLSHPLHETQRLRPDISFNENLAGALGKMAPEFVDQFYWVPKVIETEK